MSACPYCQHTNRDDARFCGACGRSLVASPPPPPAAPMPPPIMPGPPGGQRGTSAADLPRYGMPPTERAPAHPPHSSPPGQPPPGPPPPRRGSPQLAIGLVAAAVLIGLGRLYFSREPEVAALPEPTGTDAVVATVAAGADRLSTVISGGADGSDGGDDAAGGGDDAAGGAATAEPDKSLGDVIRGLATKHPVTLPTLDRPKLSDEDEIAIGEETARNIERDVGIFNDRRALDRVDRIGQLVAKRSDRPELRYRFQLLDDADVNALAVPGGFIYVTRGMLDFVRTDDELAMVLGHEVAHVALRQSAELIETAIAAERALDDILGRNPDLADLAQDERVRVAAGVAAELGVRGWGRQNELEADEFGTIYSHRATFDPLDGIALFRRMQAEFERGSSNPIESLLQTHPPFDDRVERIEETMEREGF